MESTIIDAEGKVLIPERLRNRLNLKLGDQLRLFVDPQGKHLTLTPTRSIKDGFGILPNPSHPASIEEMDEAMKNAVAEKFEKPQN